MSTERNGLFPFLPRLAILPFLAAAAFTTYWFLSLSGSAWRQIEALATANSDAVQWSLAQAEVELLVLTHYLHEAELHPGHTDHYSPIEVRNRFDVFFSRIRLLETAPVYANVRELPAVRASLDAVREFLAEAAPLIETLAPDNLESLRGLTEKADDIRPLLRTISLAGVEVSAAASERQRDRVAAELARLAIFALLLFIALLILLVALAGLLSLARKRTVQVRAEQERMRSVVAAALDGIIVADTEGRVIECNDPAVRIFGYSRKEALGQELAALLLPEHLREAHVNEMRQYWETGDSRIVDKGLVMLAGRTKTGRIFPVEMSVARAQADHGSTLVYFIRDISDRIAAKEELVEARYRALKGEKAKADLLAVMSHEMRTPLNGILGSLELLMETRMSPRQRKFIDAMQKSGQMLLDRVNTVLEISRFDAGQIESARKVFDPVALVRGIADTFGAQARTRRNRLKVTAVGPALTPCLGDPGKIEQVLVNLIGNANKFTESGSIEIEIERLQNDEQVEFRVIDNGIGIEEKDLARVFDDFVTLDISYGRKVEGTGLGLGISRRLVQAMQGTMGVESQPKVGSVFWVRLPLPAAPAVLSTTGQPERQPVGTARRDLSVLLIEDNAINRLVAREMLESLNCQVTEARDGTDGLAIAASFRFDVILMDISMPKLDGVEAAQRIRQGNGPNATTPIIALTAHALAEDLDRFRAAGMVEALVKPVAKADLEAALSAFAHPSSDAGGPSIHASAAAGDLQDLLGKERSRTVLAEAQEEIAQTLHKLAGLDIDTAADCYSADLHQMLGLASVVGFAHLIPHLQAASVALREGNRHEASKALAAARAALRPNKPRVDATDPD